MAKKLPLKDKILDFKLASQKEICAELGRRLKMQRLLKKFKQQDLAVMAGVSVGTVKNLEAKGQSSIESLVRVTMALDLTQELATLFEIKISSIDQMARIEKLSMDRIPRRVR